MRMNAAKNKWGDVCRCILLMLFAFIASLIIACGSNSPTTMLATPTAAPRADNLTEQQAATLASLKKIDDHPLYTMRYVGAYDTRASLTELWTVSRSSSLATPAWACSLFTALGDANNMLYGRNFDWEPSPAILLFTEPPGGYASVSMVDIAYLGFTGDKSRNVTDLSLAERRALLRAPFLPFDGMNARGLAVGMAAVPPGNMKSDLNKETIDSLQVIRKMLDSAATVDEAVAIMQRYNIDWGGGPPLHYLIADASGRTVLVEFYSGKMNTIPNESKWHLATNFLRSSVENTAGQCWRYDKINQQLTQTNGRANQQDAQSLLQSVAQNNTQWSIVYGMSSGDVQVTMGRKYDRVHKFELRLTGK